MAFCFSDAHAAIDWNWPPESLNKELQQIVREAEVGKRLADKLFKVWQVEGVGDLEVSLRFPAAKLLDYETQWQVLEESNNLFAVMVMAHLKTNPSMMNFSRYSNKPLQVKRKLNLEAEQRLYMIE